MSKSVFKVLPISIILFLCLKCDDYEFPETPYPRVRTLSVIDVSSGGVKLRGNIIQLGETPIIEHGFVWGFDKRVTQEIGNEGILRLGARTSMGQFQGDVLSELVKDETYYVRAFANTESRQVYGDAVMFVGP